MSEPDELDRRIGPVHTVRSAFDQLSPIVACHLGPELRVAAANAAYRDFVGRSEVIGRPIRELVPEWVGQQIVPMSERVYRTGQTQVGREWRVQVEHPESGQTHELFLDFVLEPLRDETRAIIGIIGYGLDVTERVHQRLAEQARAVEAERRYQATRDVVSELQQALLPTELPILPQLDIAARYLIAAHDQAAGGDWFDAVPLDDRRVVLIVGDVVGHGVIASAAMGQLRAVLNHVVMSSPDLASAIASVNAYAAYNRSLRAATVAVVAIDPTDGRFECCLCGHPPPLIVGADGATTFLQQPGSAPLGVGHQHTTTHGELAPGEVMLLYSDGFIERPGRTLTDGSRELAEVAADAVANRTLPAGAADGPSARVCQLTVELLTRTGYSDDVTALAVQRLVAQPSELSLSVLADAQGLAAVVDATRAWLSELRVGDETALKLELAVNEAAANVIQHAYPAGQPGPLRIAARLDADGTAEVSIGDDGSWGAPVGRGTVDSRGLGLMKRLVDAVTITHPRSPHPVGSGTLATVRHTLSRPALPASGGPGPGLSPLSPLFATELHRADNTATLHVVGTVDATTADRFARELADAAQGGTIALTVDLTAVSLLSSTGVRALFDARSQLDAHHQSLTLVAPAASPAALVLDLVGLPYA